MVEKFYNYVWRLREEFFGSLVLPFDRLDLRDAAWTWFKQLLQQNVLPKECAPSGSFPDAL